jgi:hypothetical protein
MKLKIIKKKQTKLKQKKIQKHRDKMLKPIKSKV